ncbi:hypothetical protein NKI17_25645, partial [Mesorhizobium sp. M0816]
MAARNRTVVRAFDGDVGDEVLGGVEARQQSLPLRDQRVAAAGRDLAAEEAGIVGRDTGREIGSDPVPFTQIGIEADPGNRLGDCDPVVDPPRRKPRAGRGGPRFGYLTRGKPPAPDQTAR